MFRINLGFLPLAVVALVSSVSAQQQIIDLGPFDAPLPEATVGVPYSINFGEGLEAIPAGESGVTFSYGFTTTGALPPGISLKSSGSFSGTPTTPGKYATPIKFTLTYSFTDGTQQFGITYTYTLNATLTVVAGTGPEILVAPRGLAFSTVQGGKDSLVQSLTLSNRGSRPWAYTAAATAQNRGWLSVPAAGSVPAFNSASLAVTVNAAGLPPGFYAGKVTIAGSAGGAGFDIAVGLAVSGDQQSIVLSQTGLTFQTVAGGGSVPPGTLTVLAGGAADLSWTATAATLASGSGWLSISPASGRSTARAGAPLNVSVNATGLAAGQYYGTVQVAAPGVSNSPQSISVVLSVLPEQTNILPVIAPTGLIFVGQAGGAKPAAQSVTITNVSRRPYNIGAATFTDSERKWLAVQPSAGSSVAEQPLRFNIQPDLTGLSAGVYLGEVDLRLQELNTIRPIVVLLVVLPAAPPSSGAVYANGCTPKALYPVFTTLGGSFTTVAAWPAVIEVRVVDDCAQPMTAGSVTATFSSGDPPLVLTSLPDGRWTGTWQPRAQEDQQVTVTVKAQQTDPKLEGTAQIGGAVQANSATPAINAGGAVSAASFQPLAPIAPGSIVAVFGQRLANGLSKSQVLPLETDLAGTQVFLGGKRIPLHFSSEGQINLIIPYDLPLNSSQQLLVRKGNALSVPEPVAVAAAQPAVFTQNQSGGGPGIIWGFKPDGTSSLVSSDNPVSAQSVIVIWCTGLGQVDQPVVAGSAAPGAPLARTLNPVSVTVGGLTAHVDFAGLTPGLAGLYQVNAVVPDGVSPGDSVPVVITVAGQSSPPVTMAVR